MVPVTPAYLEKITDLLLYFFVIFLEKIAKYVMKIGISACYGNQTIFFLALFQYTMVISLI